MVENYLKLSSRVPLFQVRFRQGLENLEEVLAAVESEVPALQEV